MKVAAVIPAAGRGKRLGAGLPKAFVRVLGKPLLAHTLENLNRSYPFTEIILAVDSALLEKTRLLLKKYGFGKRLRLVAGGATRAESVQKAASSVSPKCDWVLVHDAARPLVDSALVRRTLAAARRSGVALAAMLSTATVKQARGGTVTTLDRRGIHLAQTPQVFKKKLLLDRYRKLGKKALMVTDEAALFDGTGRVSLVVGDEKNIKITTPADLELFKFYLRK